MENIVLYTHANNLDKLRAILEMQFGKVKIEQNGGVTSLTVVADKTIFSSGKTLIFNIQQREKPDYQLTEIVDNFTQNLAGMCNLVNQVPLDDFELKTKLMAKIGSLNSGIAIIAKPGFVEKFKKAIFLLTENFDAILFSGKNTFFPNAAAQGFYNKKGELLLDFQGNSHGKDLEVNIDGVFFEEEQGVTPVGNATDWQLRRKEGAENILKECGVKINATLPCIADAKDVKLQTQDAVVDRCLALFACAVKSEEDGGLSLEDLQGLANQFGIYSKFSPKEKIYYADMNADEQDRANFLWRYESLYLLLWALGFTEELTYPDSICDVPFVAKTVFSNGEKGFRAAAKLRGVNEILDQMDLAYRCHWAVVDARVKNENVSGNLNSSVVYERHYAFNWLTNYMNQPWDDVQTHT